MKNKCKHEEGVLLTDYGISAVRWWWCPTCGATRMEFKDGEPSKWSRWRSPKQK